MHATVITAVVIGHTDIGVKRRAVATDHVSDTEEECLDSATRALVAHQAVPASTASECSDLARDLQKSEMEREVQEVGPGQGLGRLGRPHSDVAFDFGGWYGPSFSRLIRYCGPDEVQSLAAACHSLHREVFLGTELWESVIRRHYLDLRRACCALSKSPPDFDLPSAYSTTKAGLCFYDMFLQHFATSSHLQDFTLRSLEVMSRWVKRACDYKECRSFLKIATFPPGNIPNAVATLLRIRKRLVSLLRAEILMQHNVRRGEAFLRDLRKHCDKLIEEFGGEELEALQAAHVENLTRLTKSLAKVLSIIKTFLDVATRGADATENLVNEAQKLIYELTQRTDEVWPFQCATTLRQLRIRPAIQQQNQDGGPPRKAPRLPVPMFAD